MKQKRGSQWSNRSPLQTIANIPVVFTHNGREESALWVASRYSNHSTIRPFEIGSPAEYSVSWEDVLKATPSNPLRIRFPWQSETPASLTDIGSNLVPIEDACPRCGERDADKLELPDEEDVHPIKIIAYRKCLTCGYQKK